jgi:hypothetical protein
MMGMDLPTIGLTAALVVAAIVLGCVWWSRAHQKTPAERERLRRLAVNATGRLTDGVLVEAPYAQAASRDPQLLFFRYQVAGVEYTAAQDVSSLLDEDDAGALRSGTTASVKYDPRKPSNSIVVCETWRGLPGADPKRPPDAIRASSGNS